MKIALDDLISREESKEFSQSLVRINAVGVKDIIFLFAIFAFVLYMLFPKETLKEKVLKETKSNDLALVYIENMINFDYKNYQLLLHYADIHFKEDHFDSVRDIVKILLKSDNPEIQKSASVLGEKVFKREYFLLEKQEDRKKLLKKYESVIQEMIFISKDKNFQNDLLIYLKENYSKDEYAKLLKKLSKLDNIWKEKLAQYYVEHNNLQDALTLYKEMLYAQTPYKDKKIIFSKVVEILMFGSFFEEGVKIVQKYENLFLEDEEIFEQVIRFYLASNNSKKAREYILKRENY